MLNIPIKHVGGNEGRQKYSEVEMDNESRWKKIHWRTLETAYRTSPFFEFYEDDLKPLFEGPETSLYQFNVKALQVLGECLGIQIPTIKTESYEPVLENMLDGRFLVEAKKQIHTKFDPYSQVFEERHGFLPDLSILDLLFNEGTNSLDYLKRQPLDFLNV